MFCFCLAFSLIFLNFIFQFFTLFFKSFAFFIIVTKKVSSWPAFHPCVRVFLIHFQDLSLVRQKIFFIFNCSRKAGHQIVKFRCRVGLGSKYLCFMFIKVKPLTSYLGLASAQFAARPSRFSSSCMKNIRDFSSISSFLK